VFDVHPGRAGDRWTAIPVTYLHAPGADPTNPNTGASGMPNRNYTVFETFPLTRPRRDGQDAQNGQNGIDRRPIYAGRVG
jgi:hypothetical protein